MKLEQCPIDAELESAKKFIEERDYHEALYIIDDANCNIFLKIKELFSIANLFLCSILKPLCNKPEARVSDLKMIEIAESQKIFHHAPDLVVTTGRYVKQSRDILSSLIRSVRRTKDQKSRDYFIRRIEITSKRLAERKLEFNEYLRTELLIKNSNNALDLVAFLATKSRYYHLLPQASFLKDDVIGLPIRIRRYTDFVLLQDQNKLLVELLVVSISRFWLKGWACKISDLPVNHLNDLIAFMKRVEQFEVHAPDTFDSSLKDLGIELFGVGTVKYIEAPIGLAIAELSQILAKGLDDLIVAMQLALNSDVTIKIDDLTRLAYVATHKYIYEGSPGNIETAYRLARRLLDRYFTDGTASNDYLKIKGFWSLWINLFIRRGRYDLVLDVVAAAHGRHTAAQALAALELERIRLGATGDVDTERYLDLHKRLHQIQANLASFGNLDGGGRGGMRGGFASAETDEQKAPEYEALKREEWQLREEWRVLGKQLIKAGKLPESIAAGAMTDADLRPKSGQALATWVVPKEFGLDLPPFMLLRTCANDETEALFLEGMERPDFAHAEAVEERFATLMARGRCVRNAGNCATKTGAEADDDPHVETSSSALDKALRDFLEQKVWPRIEVRCQATLGRDKTLHMITTGNMHALPWQGTATERGRNLYLHPGPFAYSKYRKTRGDAVSRERPRPSPELPLLVLAHEAAEDIQRRLYCIPLEVAILKAVWGDDAVVVGEPSAPGHYAALACLGHGHFDPQTGRAGLVLGFGPPPFHFDEQRLAADANRYFHVEASACLLGRVTDQRNEPAGMMAAALARSQLTLTMGALMPVDDLLTTLRTLLIHVLWKEGESLRGAARQALACLESGVWPPTAVDVLRLALVQTLPEMAKAMEQDGHKLRQQGRDTARIDRLRLDLALDESPQLREETNVQWKCLVHALMAVPSRDYSQIVQKLSTLIATSLPAIVKQRDDLLAFTRYWMVC